MQFAYSFLDKVFAPITSVSPVATVACVSVMMALLLTVLNRLLVDQTKIRLIREELKKLRTEMKKAQDGKDEKKMKKVMAKNMELSHKQLTMTMKPLMYSMVFVFMVLPWLRHTFADLAVSLPVGLPIIGNAVGWLGLYIIVSMPSTVVFRKALGVQ